MKKIGILVDSLADEGLTNAQMSNAREIMRRIDLEQFEISVFCSAAPDPVIGARSGIKIISLPQRRMTARILREFITGKHQIVFYLKSSPASRLYTLLRKRWRDTRVTVGTIESQSNLRDEPTITHEAVRLWEQTVLKCDYLFSNSDAVRESLKREYALESQIVPTGVDTAFYEPANAGSQNRRPRVLFVGSLRPFKGPHTVLDAARRCPQADFVLVGDGVAGDELKVRAQRERINNASFPGALPASKTRQEYQAADIFLFPSRWEGSPKVLLEAAACGVPVIARGDYRPESVIDRKTGYLVGSDNELFARLDELLARPDLRRTLGNAGRQHSLAFDWRLITRKWEEVFRALAQGMPVRQTA